MASRHGEIMSKLYLYAVLHGNLQFSSIPKEQYATILERCYSPVLELSKELRCPLGLEFPGFSLEVLKQIDNTFITRLADGWKKGYWEIIGSGYSQSIYPLIPAEVNRFNLEEGNRVYKQVLGNIPSVAYVNEQVFSQGLVEVFKEAGFQAIIMDWENAAMASDLSAYVPYQPKLVTDGYDGVIPVIWSSFIAFQRFQRYIHGEIEIAEYLRFLIQHYSELEDRVMPFYGSDWEIFDYRPGTMQPLYLNPFASTTIGKEILRLKELLKVLNEDNRFEIIAPSQVLKLFCPQDVVSACSPSYPIPTKKQAKYNVARWAVCGRDNTKINTEMFETLYQINRVNSLSRYQRKDNINQHAEAMRSLSYLWGSDFRTFTTEEKHYEFHNTMGRLRGKLALKEKTIGEELTPDKGLIIINPHDFSWKGLPLELDIGFLPGEHFDPVYLELEGQKVVTQTEHKEFYSDGSLRRAKLLVSLRINPLEKLRGTIVSTKGNPIRKLEWISDRELKTSSVGVSFLPSKGGAIKELVFPQIHPQSLAGTISHEFYEQADLSTDQFTGNTVIFDRFKGKITDLIETKLMFPANQELFPVRIPVITKLVTPFGDLWKRYYVYQDSPRIDLEYHFRFQNLMPLSLRLGILTLNPEPFKRKNMILATVNGGNTVEKYLLDGACLRQSESVDPRVSSKHCLGATEGWIYVGDEDKGVGAITKKSALYSVPLVDYHETVKSFYFRAYHSLCENDETSFQFWRGHSDFDLSLVGTKGDIQSVREQAVASNQGLLVLSKEYSLRNYS